MVEFVHHVGLKHQIEFLKVNSFVVGGGGEARSEIPIVTQRAGPKLATLSFSRRPQMTHGSVRSVALVTGLAWTLRFELERLLWTSCTWSEGLHVPPLAGWAGVPLFHALF